MVTRRPTSSSVITTSSACRHVAMLPFLVQIFPNEESTNIIPVPWMLASSRPVSRNRSSSSFSGWVSPAVATAQDGLGWKEEAMRFRPLHDRVLVKRIEAEAKSPGGIIIPDTAMEKPQEGEVIAVGPGGRDQSGKLTPIDVKVGNRVLFGKWSGTEIKLDGVETLIMKESDLMGVLEEAGGRKKAA